MKCYIVINKTEIELTEVFKCRVQACKYAGIHVNTLKRQTYQNKNYLILYKNIIPSDKKGNNPGIK